MREVRFPQWAEVLAATDLPERKQHSWVITLRWNLGFCRRTRAGVNVKAFLDDLALNERLSASSQRQALNAVVFQLREVYGKELGDFSDYRRAKARAHAPSWLTSDEVTRLLDQLEDRWVLLSCVAFGGGLRVMELLRFGSGTRTWSRKGSPETLQDRRFGSRNPDRASCHRTRVAQRIQMEDGAHPSSPTRLCRSSALRACLKNRPVRAPGLQANRFHQRFAGRVASRGVAVEFSDRL